MIYYFKPYDTRGLGYAYNSHCALVPKDDDWICLMDMDTMYFSSQCIGELLEGIIARHAANYAAFTSVTNRAYRESCQQLPKIRDERDLVKLKVAADQQLWKGRHQVTDLTTPLNGQFLLFQKKVWNEFPFAAKGGSKKALGHHILGIDTDWRDRLYAAGKKIGVIRSLMATHYYRLDDAQEMVGHLPGGMEWWKIMTTK